MRKLITLGILVFGFIAELYACKAIAPDSVNLAVSTKYNRTMFYNTREVLDERPKWEIYECQKTAIRKKYVMIALGIENKVFSDENNTFSYAEPSQHECRIENSPFQNKYTYDNGIKAFKERREFLNSCVTVQVTDFSPRGIRYPEEQPGCKITKISKHSVDFEGRYCFFQPSYATNYSVHLQVKPECMTKEGLAEKKVPLMDFMGILNFYVAGDATGKSIDLTALTSTEVRYTVNPVNEIVKESDDFGMERPTFPLNWLQQDIFMGEPRISSEFRYDKVFVPLWVDTRCERKCVDGLCSSPCDYIKPVVAEYLLTEIQKDGKEVYIDSWYDGGVASSQWQGQINGLGKEIQKEVLQQGNQYRLDIIFRDPDVDFGYYAGRIRRVIEMRRNYIGPIKRHNLIDQVPEITPVLVGQDIPTLEGIYGIRFDGHGLDSLDRAQSRLHTLVDNKFWPPYYDNICLNDGGLNCKDLGQEFLQMSVQFTLGEKDKETLNYKLENVMQARKSSLSGEVKTMAPVEGFPKINCL